MTGRALCLLRISLNVVNLSRARTYYEDALGFTTVTEDEAEPAWVRLIGGEGVRVRIARLRLGAQELELAEFDPPSAKYPADSNAADLWFQHIAIVTNDIAAAGARLKQHGATPITQGGPQRLPPATGSVTACKFRDPDGHPAELIHFPLGVGDPAWQSDAAELTIGIDHSALSVSDPESSLVFYSCLGLNLRSRQINSGPEQDRLDGLPGVTVDVIGLSPAAQKTPHVELLRYQTPRGRSGDPARNAFDIADTKLIFQVEGLVDLTRLLALAGFTASPVVELASAARAARLRDPDGHAILLIEDP
jgi:catechol 2,3-dioxygenase-like lactoylglutathione lyase family enzyme